jgi:hypothetical protein
MLGKSLRTTVETNGRDFCREIIPSTKEICFSKEEKED